MAPSSPPTLRRRPWRGWSICGPASPTRGVFGGSVFGQLSTLARHGTHLHPNDGLRRLLDEGLGGGTQFADLSVQFECVAASIERATAHWFSAGSVTDAVLASCAVPGLLPPVEIAGEHFLDGGLVRSVPIGRAAELGATRIFVLHVGRLEQPLQPPTRPWQVALVAFEIARRHQFEEEFASLPQGVAVHVLPSGSTAPALSVRYRSTSGVRGRIDAAYDAASAFLDRVSHALRTSQPMRLVLPRPLRRLLLPVVAVILLVLAAVFAVITVIAAVLAPLGRRRRVLRMAAFALNYCIVELVVVFAAGLLYLRHVVAGRRRAGSEASWVNANQRLLAWALGRVLGAARRFLGFEVVVVETSDTSRARRD